MIIKYLRQSYFLRGLAAAAAGLRADIQTYRRCRHRTRAISNYLATPGAKRMHLGCGTHVLPGWLNADLSPTATGVIYVNATQPLPFDANTFDCLFSEHLIEHLKRQEGLSLLRECWRVLKPGGVIRISTPNFDNIVSLMTMPTTSEKQSYISAATARYFPDTQKTSPGLIVNNFLYDFGHQFNYTPDDLVQALEQAEFNAITPCTSGHSRIPELCQVEGHARRVGTDLDSFETMIFEANKPG